jgi:uncharacterized protein
MTEQEKIRSLVEMRMRRAGMALRAARTLFAEDLHEDSVSRAYYAMFHAASALLLTKGLSTSKHKGVLSLFDLHFVKPAILGKELSAWIRGAFKARQEADYDAEAVDPRASAAAALANAEAFLRQVRPVLERLLDELNATAGNR